MSDRLTAQDAAKMLGYHVNHVYRLLRDGALKGEQFNRVWIIPRSEIARVKQMQNDHGRLPKGTLTP